MRMIRDDLVQRISNFQDETLKYIAFKGNQYSPLDDALRNFTEGSAAVGLIPEQYLMALAEKHWHAMGQWVAGRRSYVEPAELRERILDIVVYLSILRAMIDQEEEQGGKD